MLRRDFVVALGFAPIAGWAGESLQKNSDESAAAFTTSVAAIERRIGGRIGVGVLDTHTGRRVGHRGGELFPMASTFKLLLAAQTLRLVDEGKEQLGRRITYRPEDLLAYSPATGPHADGTGMTVEALCEGTMTLSDNTAANLLLASHGGPPALTAFVRSQGDARTRLDRIEPALNEALPGDPRDTTTPEAMVDTMQALVLGTALSPASRQKLQAWLLNNKTGDKRLRAGVPAGWRVGDKTGTGERGTSNDVGVFWPPGRKPLLVSCYLTGGDASAAERDAAIAAVAAQVVQWAGG